MILQVDFLQLVLALGGLLGFFSGVLATLTHAFFRQFEGRLQAKFAAAEEAGLLSAARTDQRLGTVEAQLREIERHYGSLRAEMMREYVRREDQIRDQTVTSAKLDGLAAKIELVTQIVARFEGGVVIHKQGSA